MAGGVYGVSRADLPFAGEAGRRHGCGGRTGDNFGGEGIGEGGLWRGKLVGNCARQTGGAEGDFGGGVFAGSTGGERREIRKVTGLGGDVRFVFS